MRIQTGGRKKYRNAAIARKPGNSPTVSDVKSGQPVVRQIPLRSEIGDDLLASDLSDGGPGHNCSYPEKKSQVLPDQRQVSPYFHHLTVGKVKPGIATFGRRKNPESGNRANGWIPGGCP